jgi:hypothetical protein
MKDWRIKCTLIAKGIKDNAEVLKDLADGILGYAMLIHSGATSLNQDEAREVHLGYASLLDQLDSIVPKVNAIKRTMRSRSAVANRLEREGSVQSTKVE